LSGLGPSLILAGCPLALGASLLALRSTNASPLALFAVAISGLETIALCALLINRLGRD
jgi:hypothetical protein